MKKYTCIYCGKKEITQPGIIYPDSPKCRVNWLLICPDKNCEAWKTPVDNRQYCFFTLDGRFMHKKTELECPPHLQEIQKEIKKCWEFLKFTTGFPRY